MPIPFSQFHPDHLTSAGANAPDCLIKVFLTCATGDCAAGAFVAEVIEDATNTVLASGPVSCTGASRLHGFPMTVKRPLSAVAVVLRYTCGTAAPEEEPIARTIFLGCR
jgi:hypothetical protein